MFLGLKRKKSEKQIKPFRNFYITNWRLIEDISGRQKDSHFYLKETYRTQSLYHDILLISSKYIYQLKFLNYSKHYNAAKTQRHFNGPGWRYELPSVSKD